MEERNTTSRVRRTRPERVRDEIVHMPFAEIEALAGLLTLTNEQLACMVSSSLAKRLGLTLAVQAQEPLQEPQERANLLRSLNGED